MDIAQNHTVPWCITDFGIQGFDLNALHDGIWDCIMASFEYGPKLLISISRTILKVSILKGTLRDCCFCHDGKKFPEDVFNYVEAGRWSVSKRCCGGKEWFSAEAMGGRVKARQRFHTDHVQRG